MRARKNFQAKPIEITKILFFIFVLFYFLKFNNLNGRIIGALGLTILIVSAGVTLLNSQLQMSQLLVLSDLENPFIKSILLGGSLYLSSFLHRA